MTYKENITAILECYFTGFKKEIIDSACNRILEQEPSGDLISREETLTAFADYVGSGMSMNDYEALWDIVAKMPPVKQESKTGHWIYDNYNWRCSECNETPKTLGYVGTADFMTEHFKFCNHCGAKMVEPQESEE